MGGETEAAKKFAEAKGAEVAQINNSLSDPRDSPYRVSCVKHPCLEVHSSVHFTVTSLAVPVA